MQKRILTWLLVLLALLSEVAALYSLLRKRESLPSPDVVVYQNAEGQ